MDMSLGAFPSVVTCKVVFVLMSVCDLSSVSTRVLMSLTSDALLHLNSEFL